MHAPLVKPGLDWVEMVLEYRKLWLGHCPMRELLCHQQLVAVVVAGEVGRSAVYMG
jgi:hypothetical protein